MTIPDLLRTVSESRVNYRASYVMDVASALTMGWLGMRGAEGWALPAAIVGAGLVTFSFAEYAIHRWLFHGPTGVMRAIHQAHHDGPDDHVALPCISSFVVGGFLWLVLSTAVGAFGASWFMCGFLTGYVAYGSVHHFEHSVRISALPFRFLQRRWAGHAVHHRLIGTNFGVTTSFWDRVFGTHYQSRLAARPGART